MSSCTTERHPKSWECFGTLKALCPLGYILCPNNLSHRTWFSFAENSMATFFFLSAMPYQADRAHAICNLEAPYLHDCKSTCFVEIWNWRTREGHLTIETATCATSQFLFFFKDRQSFLFYVNAKNLFHMSVTWFNRLAKTGSISRPKPSELLVLVAQVIRINIIQRKRNLRPICGKIHKYITMISSVHAIKNTH